MAENNLIIDLKIEVSFPKNKSGKYTIALSDANLYKVKNNKLITLDVIVSDKPRGAGSSGDKPRGAGSSADKPKRAKKGNKKLKDNS